MMENNDVNAASLHAKLSHTKNENFILRETLAQYDRSFVFLCSHMERSQLCRAVSKIKAGHDTPLPSAVRSFLSRNVKEGRSEMDLDETSVTHPVLSSAQALTRWANRRLQTQKFQDSRVATKTLEVEDTSSLALAETKFKVRNLEQQLRSSQAIREDLLNKALEAEQQSRITNRNLGTNNVAHTHKYTHATHTDARNGQLNPDSDADYTSPRLNQSNLTLTVEMQQWQKRCDELEDECERLRTSLTKAQEQDASTRSKRISETKSITENGQKWLQSELKSAKNTIRQLRALVQAKQDKIDSMEQLTNLPRRN